MTFKPYTIVGTSQATNEWLDLYTVARQTSLDWIMDHREEVKKERRVQDKRYEDLTRAWDKVRKQLQIFGLELNENQLEMWPNPDEVTGNQRSTQEWLRNPELKLWRERDVLPLHYVGNEAVAALGFLTFFVNSVRKFNPRARVRELLLKQGIDAHNFHEYEHKLNIQNPFITP